MNRKEKAAMVEEYIKLYPTHSNNWLAEDLGVKNTFVDRRRTKLEADNELTLKASLTGKDGVERPRSRTPFVSTPQLTTTEPVEKPTPAPEQPQPRSEPQVEKPLGVEAEVRAAAIEL